MEKIKSIILFLLIFIIFNDTFVAGQIGLFSMRIIYALFLVFFSTDIINSIKNLRGIVNISIFSFLIFLILSSLIYLISVKNYPYENFYNMLIITSIFLVFSKYKNDYILKFVIFSVFFSSIYSIVRPDTISEWTFRKTGGTGDPNEFACHLIIGFILTWNHINNRILKLVLLTLFSFTIILSGSITGGLCFFLMVIYKIFSIFRKQINLKSIILTSFGVMISYFIVLRLDVLVLYLNRAFTNTNNLISRQKAWINGIALFRENWYTFLIGGGPNFFDQRNSLLVSSKMDTAIAAHSMYIEILADTGIIGFILIICPIMYILFKNLFNPKHDIFFVILFMSLSLSMTYEKYFWLIFAFIL
mgnify:CR=1 FL=1